MSRESEIFTGERFVPGINDPELYIEHIQRYSSIVECVKDKIVIDAACGEGYGSAILAEKAKRVIGFDIDAGAVERANKNYGKTNVEFHQGDISKLPIDDKVADVFVSFETIEHVDEKLQKKFISEVKRVLKDDGIFIISSPNKAIYSDLFHYHNEFHVHELYKEEFTDLLKCEFEHIHLFHQYFEVASIIDSNEHYGKNAEFVKDREQYVSDGKYFIAIASNRTIDDIVLESVYLNQTVLHRKNIQRILTLQKEEEQRNEHIKKLDQHIEELDHRIAGLVEEASIANDRVAGLVKEVSIANSSIEKKSGEINVLQEELNGVNQSLNNKEGHIQLLLQSERSLKAQLDAVQNSRTYRLANIFKKASVTLLPPMSLRRRMASKAYGVLRAPQRHKLEQQYNQVKSEEEIDQSATVQTLEKIKPIEEYEQLVFPEYEKPLVTIIIPVYNQFGYTYNCLKSILQNSGIVEYEIIIGDDCSTDATQKIDQIVKNITVARTSHNMRFLGNCNNAAKLAKGSYILFLNNDTEVQKNWLQPLVDLMKKDSSIGMVGSKLVYSDGTLQEAGGIIWGDGHAWNYGNGQMADKPEFNYVKEVDYISGAAIMIRSRLWEEIGGFDDYFAPAYCEDSDLAFEVRKHGYKVVYQPLSVVVHFEGKSNGTDVKSGVKKYQTENSRKLAEKWKDEFAMQSQTESDLFHARERSQGKKVILIVDHYVPTFDKDAGSKTTFQYIKMFIEKGYNVKFIGDNFAKMEPYTTILQQMGVEVLYGPWYAQHIFEWIEDNKEFIDFAYLNRPHITVKYIDFLKEKTNIKLIYYGHDLHFLRVQREAEMEQNSALEKEAEDWRKKEFSIMKKVAMSYYPSYVEEKAIHNVDASIPVKAITAYVFDSFQENFKYDSKKKSGLLFVGGFGHGPNIDAVKWFVSEIWPAIKDKIDGEFYIVGSNAPDEIKKLAGDGIIFKGFVSEEELQSLYQRCKMAVVPLRYGAGVKGKVIEAIYNGIPIVTTNIGAEGIPEIDQFVVVEDSADTFAKQVVDLYGDDVKLAKMAEQSQQYIKEHFSMDAVWNIVKGDFE